MTERHAIRMDAIPRFDSLFPSQAPPHSHCHTASLQAGAVGAAASSEVEGVTDDERRIGASAKRPRAPPARLMDSMLDCPAVLRFRRRLHVVAFVSFVYLRVPSSVPSSVCTFGIQRRCASVSLTTKPILIRLL